MKEFPLTRGKFALVDDEDYLLLTQQKKKWYYDPKGYAKRRCYKTGKIVEMGHHLLGIPMSQELDHKDHNGLNVQRSNLRECTHAQNGGNHRKHKNTSSKYKGVSWNKRAKKWQVNIMLLYKNIYLGRFDSEEDAARVYDIAAKTAFQEFADLNLPEEI